MRKVVVTGGAGFIGSNLIPKLAELDDCQITVIDNEYIGKLSLFEELNVECVKADILDKELMEQLVNGTDTIFHFAADTRVVNSIEKPDFNFENNVVGTYTLLCAARKAGVRRFLNASTGGAILGEIEPPSHEEMAPRPLSPYGASKLAAEGYCSAFYGAYNLKTASLRFSNIYGPRSFHKGSVIAHFFKKILTGGELIVYGDGSQTRDFLYVDDLVSGLCKFMQSDATGIFQLGSGQPITINDLISSIKVVVGHGYNIQPRYAAFRPGEVRHTYCDINKARKEVNFSVKTSLECGLRQTWKWFLSETR